MGSNFEGKLGLNDKNLKNTNAPQLVETLMNIPIESVSCGDNHTIAVTKN